MKEQGFSYKIIFGFLAVTLLYCRKAFVGGQVLLPLGGDHVHSVYNSMHFFHDCIKSGIFPLWNPLVVCGHPFGVHSITIFSLYHLLAIPWNAGTAYNLVTMAGMFLGAVFLYLFLLRKGVSGFAAWIAGLGWMLGTSRDLDTGFFFLPLSIYLADRLVEKKRRFDFAALTFSLAFYSVNANPQYYLYGGLFLFFYILSSELRLNGPTMRGVLLATLPFVLAGGMMMVYFTRLFEMALGSNRESWDIVQVLLPTHYIQAIFPKIFYSPQGPELNYVIPRILQGVFSTIPVFKNVQFFVWPPYVGLLPVAGFLAVMLSSDLRKRSDPFVRFFIAAVFTVLIYLTFHPLFYLTIVRHLPLVKGMTGVLRTFNIYRFALAVLCAVAVDRAFLRTPENRRIFQKVGWIFGALSGAIVFVMTAARIGVLHFKDLAAQKVAAHLHAVQNPTLFIENTEKFRQQRVEEFFDFFRQVCSVSNPHFWVPLGMAAVLIAGILFYQSGKITRGLFKAFLTLFVALDLCLAMGSGLWASSPQDIHRHSALADFIKQDKGIYRVFAIEDKTRSIHRMFLRPESNMSYGIATPDGYEQLYRKRYVKFYEWLSLRRRPPGPLHFTDDFNKPLVDFLNCKYIITNFANPKLDGRPDMERILNGPDYKIYRNKDAMPRAFIVHRQKVVATPEEAEAVIRKFPGRLSEEVLLEGGFREPLDARYGSGSDEVKIVKYEPNQVEMDLRLNGEGYLVMTDSYFPGWRAILDGNPSKIEQADYAFRAVRVPDGHHELRMVYQPSSLKWGAFLSVLSLAGLWIVLSILL